MGIFMPLVVGKGFSDAGTYFRICALLGAQTCKKVRLKPDFFAEC